MKYWQSSRGFSLMELMVVVGIIGLLIAALSFPLSAAREKGRDRKRMADLGQIEFALAAYVNTYGTEIDCDDGFKIDGSADPADFVSMPDGSSTGGSCTDGQAVLTFMEQFLGSVPVDPKGPNDATHYYYFDPQHTCLSGSGDAPLLFVTDLETEGSNAGDVCAVVAGDEGGYMDYEPHVQVIEFSE
jgi:prepilin-type N-terminal cleavage/methylation domain-containing protein